MPYQTHNDPDLPDHVREMDEEKRRQWVAVFNETYSDTHDEGEAMAAANAAVKAVNLPTAVKALEGEGRIGGYLVTWGDPARKDLQGEFFTPATDLALDWYPTRPALYHHGLDGEVGPLMIGQIDSMKADSVGVWVEAQLDLRNQYARAVLNLVDRGVLGWSSGSLPHLVHVERTGEIKRWPIVEGSLTPTPAEPRQPSVLPVKHFANTGVLQQAYKSAGIADISSLLPPDDTSEGAGATEQGEQIAGSRAERDIDRSLVSMEGNPMPDTIPSVQDEANMNALVDARIDAYLKQKEEARALADLKAKAARADELEQENAALKADGRDKLAPARRLPGATQDPEEMSDPAVSGKGADIKVLSRFDDLTHTELAFGVEIMRNLARAKNAPELRPSEQYANALAAKAWQAGYRPVKKDGTAYKADELGHSTLTSYGDEWVPDMWSSELWRKARLENQILGLFRTVEMPSQPFELPIQGTDPTVYYVPETTDESQLTLDNANNPIPDSQVGTGKVTLNAKKLAVRVGFSSELVEDSLVPVLPMYTEQAMQSMQDAIDNVLLNGDTTATATGNINSDDGAPTATSKWLAFDGLRHLPLVTNTANAQDASGAPTMALLRTTRFLMAGKYSVKPENLAWIVDASTYAKWLGLTEVITIDKFGPNATVLTGQLAAVDGIPVIVSGEMGLTEADGKISTTAGNNTKGQAVCVYRPGWVVGFRRRVMASMTYIPYYDAYQLVATMRIALINFDTDVASVLYDQTV